MKHIECPHCSNKVTLDEVFDSAWDYEYMKYLTEEMLSCFDSNNKDKEFTQYQYCENCDKEYELIFQYKGVRKID